MIRNKKGLGFLIIGAMKCGTTSLYHYLCEHPNIVPAREKELHFKKGPSWYESQLSFTSEGGEQCITGEAIRIICSIRMLREEFMKPIRKSS